MIRCRLLPLALVLEREAQIELGLVIAGIELQCFQVKRDGLRQLLREEKT